MLIQTLVVIQRGDVAGAHVRRFLQNALRGERRVVVRIADGFIANRIRARVESAVAPDFAVVQGFGDDKRLHHRTGLHRFAYGEVAQAGGGVFLIIIGIVIGQAGHRQNFARLRV